MRKSRARYHEEWVSQGGVQRPLGGETMNEWQLYSCVVHGSVGVEKK